MEKIKVIAVVGPTASGKTALGVDIARRFNGEVISADSMQIYKYMNIATAKPDKAEMCGITHHLIDFVLPEQTYSVASFCRDANAAAQLIASHGKMPVVVGGTGLYIDSFLNNTTFFDDAAGGDIRDSLYRELNEYGIDKLYEELKNKDAKAAQSIHKNNTVRVIRALEVIRSTGQTFSSQAEHSHDKESRFDALYIGITFKDREKLYDRINRRVDLMLEKGLVDEAREFYKSAYAETASAAIGYKELLPFLNGEKSLDECVESLKRATRNYAKRQLTWFRRNERINWLFADECVSNDDLISQTDSLINSFLGGD